MTPEDYLFTFSFETYADAAVRGMMRPPDRIMTTLLHHSSVRRLVVADPPRWLPRVLMSPILDRGYRFPKTAKATHHRAIRLRRSDPRGIDDVERDFGHYEKSLRRAASRRGLEHPHVITTHPFVAGFGDFKWASDVTYFGRDDWLSTPAHRPLWPALSEAYARIANRERTVVAVSQQIVDRISPKGPSLVLPNGVETAEWLGPQPAEPDWLASIPHPRALYVGTLDERLDIEGIAVLAAAVPDLHIVLVGPAPDGDYTAPIRSLPNVHTHPHVDRAEIVATLRNADICLLAHRRTPLTEAMSPLKVYEYLAAGCPVLATDLPPVRAISDRILLRETVAEFPDLVPSALELGRWSEDDRVSFVEKNSWAGRHQQMLEFSRRG